MPTPTTEDHPSLPAWQDMAALRALLGPDIQPQQPIAMLYLGRQHGQLLVSDSDATGQPPLVHPLPLGLDTLAVHTFHHRMPGEAQLETGIMQVEDAIMPMQPLLPPHPVFVLQDPLLLQVAQHALGMPAPLALPAAWPTHEPLPQLHPEAIEALFDTLARQAMHPQLARNDLPQSPYWAAALLILREVLHHWQLGTLYLLPRWPAAHSPKG